MRLAATLQNDLVCVAASRMQICMQLAALHAKPPVLCNDARISIVWIKKMETYHKNSKIGRGNRFFRGLSKRTNHRFLQTRETVPLRQEKIFFKSVFEKIVMIYLFSLHYVSRILRLRSNQKQVLFWCLSKISKKIFKKMMNVS